MGKQTITVKSALDAMAKEKPHFRGVADLRKAPTAKKVLNGDAAFQAEMAMSIIRQLGALRPKITSNDPSDFFNVHEIPGYSYYGVNMLSLLLGRKDLPLTDKDVAELLGEVARFDHLAVLTMPFLPALAGWLQKRKTPLNPAARKSARKIAKALLTMEGAEENRVSKRFAAL